MLGQRRTRQRETIETVIREAGGPLTVQEILERAQEEIPGLGIATVYRTINLLQEAEQIHTVVLPSGESRYEPVGRGHHHHFQCRVCNGVFDLHECPMELPKKPLAGGFVVEDHEVTLYGRCPGCA
jgi:Fur family transcriptional regulator, ferric uptake regulator